MFHRKWKLVEIRGPVVKLSNYCILMHLPPCVRLCVTASESRQQNETQADKRKKTEGENRVGEDEGAWREEDQEKQGETGQRQRQR